MKTKELLLAVGSVIVIGVSATMLWTQRSGAPELNRSLHRGIGEALAEETLRCLGHRGDLLVITMAEADSDILAVQFDAFRDRLRASGGLRIQDVERIDSEKKAQYGPGMGLSVSKLTREVKKNAGVAGIVSFVGLPRFDDDDLAGLGTNVPPLLAFSRDAKKLIPLLERGWVRAAIVPRFQFPAPGSDNPHAPAEWFTNQYQWVRPVAP